MAVDWLGWRCYIPHSYDRFEKGSANSNASTRILQRQLEARDGIIAKLKAFFEKYFELGIAELKAEEKPN